MFDNNLEFSSNIDVILNKNEKTNEYTLIIRPNKEWLEAENRNYPITIDPTITTSRNYQDIQDTFIFKGDDNNNIRYKAHIMRIGNNNSSSTYKNPGRGLIKFTLPELKAGDQIIYASLNLCSYPKTNEWTPPNREIQIDVHKMTSNWESENAHWNDLNNSYDPKIEDYQKYKFDNNNQLKFYNFNITGIAKEWYTKGDNYGIMLKEHEEIYNYQDSDAYFITSDTSSSYYEGRPAVTIVYRNQTGLENYLSYHKQDIGRAGTVYTNDYNGNLVVLHNDTKTPGDKFSVSINHIFNTNNKDINIGYGKGFRLNFSQSIEFETINKIEYAKYIDEDGTEHYFKSDGSTYRDEDGLGLTINKKNTICTMEDKNKNVSTFTKNTEGKEIWYLSQIEDTMEKLAEISIDLRNGKITQIKDGADQNIELTYDISGNLEKLKDVNGREKKYIYNNENLIGIVYSDGKKTRYEYEDNKIKSMTNIDGYKFEYEYYKEKTGRVRKIQEKRNK